MKWVSKHIFATPLANKLHAVDTAGIGGRKGSYLGRSPGVEYTEEKSAEAIVVDRNEPRETRGGLTDQ